MKTCIKCLTPKDEESFAKGRNSCKECRKTYLRGYYATNTEYFSAYRETHREKYRKQTGDCVLRARHERYATLSKIKSSPCTDCGKSYPPCVMDFDHRDPLTKVGEISHMVKTYVPWDRVLEEIAKCDLVCVCCHRARTYSGIKGYRSYAFQLNFEYVTRLKESTPCLDCVGTFLACQMDFDHARGVKVKNVSQMMGGSPHDLHSEIAKCDLVCANCHRVRTQNRPTSQRSTRPIPARLRRPSIEMGM